MALSEIKSLKVERKRQGESGKDTKALQKRISKQIQNLKDDIGMWRAWHALFQTEPYDCPNIDESKLFNDDLDGSGQDLLPWTSKEVNNRGGIFQLQLCKIMNEMARTEEELDFLKGDAVCILHSLYWQMILLERLMQAAPEGKKFLLRARSRKVGQQYDNAVHLFMCNNLL